MNRHEYHFTGSRCGEHAYCPCQATVGPPRLQRRARAAILAPRRAHFVLVLVVTILAYRVARTEDDTTGRSPGIESPVARQLAVLANADILESSGLAVSLDATNQFWTHNDSGDSPRLFAFDDAGRDLGVVSLLGVRAIDWEDIASFRRENRGWLLVADVGDNARRRETCQLHLLPEPTLTKPTATVHTTINFRYENGPVDCEAVGVDGASNTVLLVSKSLFNGEVFSLQLPANPTDQVFVARSIANIAVPFATALDVSPDGHRAIVATYGDAFEFQRRDAQSWAAAFKNQPRVLKMPARRQGESLCYARDGYSLFLTSEKQPTPLWKVERKP